MSDFLKKLKRNKVGEGETTLDYQGEVRVLKYWIINKNMTDAPSLFVGICNDIYFISEEVPEIYRPYFIIHEEVCAFLRKNERDDHCLDALNFELTMIPKVVWDDNISFRLRFFQSLVAYREKYGEDDLLKEIRKSRNRLTKLNQHIQKR
jgi:hypothetical protein